MPCEKSCEETRDLNFKVPKSFHRDFKLVATLEGIDMRDLLFVAFDEHVKRNKHKFRLDL